MVASTRRLQLVSQSSSLIAVAPAVSEEPKGDAAATTSMPGLNSALPVVPRLLARAAALWAAGLLTLTGLHRLRSGPKPSAAAALLVLRLQSLLPAAGCGRRVVPSSDEVTWQGPSMVQLQPQAKACSSSSTAKLVPPEMWHASACKRERARRAAGSVGGEHHGMHAHAWARTHPAGCFVPEQNAAAAAGHLAALQVRACLVAQV